MCNNLSLIYMSKTNKNPNLRKATLRMRNHIHNIDKISNVPCCQLRHIVCVSRNLVDDIATWNVLDEISIIWYLLKILNQFWPIHWNGNVIFITFAPLPASGKWRKLRLLACRKFSVIHVYHMRLTVYHENNGHNIINHIDDVCKHEYMGI